MEAYLQPQLKNHQEIKNILKQVNVTHVLSDGRKVKTLLVYLPIKNGVREGANKRGNSSRLTQSFHFFMFEPIFSPVNALNQPI